MFMSLTHSKGDDHSSETVCMSNGYKSLSGRPHLDSWGPQNLLKSRCTAGHAAMLQGLHLLDGQARVHSVQEQRDLKAGRRYHCLLMMASIQSHLLPLLP